MELATGKRADSLPFFKNLFRETAARLGRSALQMQNAECRRQTWEMRSYKTVGRHGAVGGVNACAWRRVVSRVAQRTVQSVTAFLVVFGRTSGVSRNAEYAAFGR